MKQFFYVTTFMLLCGAIALSAQNDRGKTPSLQDAKTFFDIIDSMNHEISQIDKDVDQKQQAALRADIFMAGSDKLMEIAKDRNDRDNAYSLRLSAFLYQLEAEVEGAEQKMDAFLDELAAKKETCCRAEGLRFQRFIFESMKTVNTPNHWDAFKTGLKSWIYRNIDSDYMYIRSDRIGCGMLRVAEQREGDTEQFITELVGELNAFIQSAECVLSEEEKTTAMRQFEQTLELYQFNQQFYRKSLETVDSPESFNAFKVELKSWINRKTVNVDDIPALALRLAEKCEVPAEQVINELIEFIQSPECTFPYNKERIVTEWKKMLLTAYGSDLQLYGRTLDEQEIDWDSLRGKYVLVQFTATWCGPCHAEIPGMKEAYKKYHDKGFEIVSIYVFEQGTGSLASLKEHVTHSDLPWIIISETLTEKAGQPTYKTSFGIHGVPKMLLVDKTGKIMMTDARGEHLQTQLAEIFE